MLDQILSFVLLYKYFALFLITFAAAFGFPVFSTPVIMAASAFSSQKYLSFSLVYAAALAGNVAGDLLGYFVSRRAGKEIIARIGLKRLLQSRAFAALERNFEIRSASAIFLTRFLITGLGPAVNFIAGLSSITFQRYFFYEFTGELVYVSLYASLGYIFGSQWRDISDLFEKIGIIFLLAISIGAISRVIYVKKNHSKNNSGT
jgi:membrane-associated protein